MDKSDRAFVGFIIILLAVAVGIMGFVFDKKITALEEGHDKLIEQRDALLVAYEEEVKLSDETHGLTKEQIEIGKRAIAQCQANSLRIAVLEYALRKEMGEKDYSRKIGEFNSLLQKAIEAQRKAQGNE